MEAVLRPVHNNMTLNNVLHYVVFVSTLVETQHDARIDSDPILAFPCVAFLRLVVKNPPTFLVINLCVSQINAMQSLVSLCEPAFRLYSCWKRYTYMYMYASIVKSNSFPWKIIAQLLLLLKFNLGLSGFVCQYYCNVCTNINMCNAMYMYTSWYELLL